MKVVAVNRSVKSPTSPDERKESKLDFKIFERKNRNTEESVNSTLRNSLTKKTKNKQEAESSPSVSVSSASANKDNTRCIDTNNIFNGLRKNITPIEENTIDPDDLVVTIAKDVINNADILPKDKDFKTIDLYAVDYGGKHTKNTTVVSTARMSRNYG